MATAILIDGAFFLKRHSAVYGKRTPLETAEDLFKMCLAHIYNTKSDELRVLYRIFFYDCPPLDKKAHHPITGQPVDFGKLPSAAFRRDLHNELRKKRKVALRLGYLADRQGHWAINADITKKLLAGRITVADIKSHEVKYEVRQKGVDMRIGLDIAALAYKRLVNQIILVSGDSDFVPAAKLARREGIDIILDPMWQTIREDLREHVDGLTSTCPKPTSKVTETLSDSVWM